MKNRTNNDVTLTQTKQVHWSGLGINEAARLTQDREQEAQLPLRNRASAVHFFVACSYVTFYRRILRLSPPTSDDPANLLRTQRINFSMPPQHVRMTRDPTVL